jgi:hypothetical protein
LHPHATSCVRQTPAAYPCHPHVFPPQAAEGDVERDSDSDGGSIVSSHGRNKRLDTISVLQRKNSRELVQLSQQLLTRNDFISQQVSCLEMQIGQQQSELTRARGRMAYLERTLVEADVNFISEADWYADLDGSFGWDTEDDVNDEDGSGEERAGGAPQTDQIQDAQGRVVVSPAGSPRSGTLVAADAPKAGEARARAMLHSAAESMRRERAAAIIQRWWRAHLVARRLRKIRDEAQQRAHSRRQTMDALKAKQQPQLRASRAASALRANRAPSSSLSAVRRATASLGINVKSATSQSLAAQPTMTTNRRRLPSMVCIEATLQDMESRPGVARRTSQAAGKRRTGENSTGVRPPSATGLAADAIEEAFQVEDRISQQDERAPSLSGSHAAPAATRPSVSATGRKSSKSSVTLQSVPVSDAPEVSRM